MQYSMQIKNHAAVLNIVTMKIENCINSNSSSAPMALLNISSVPFITDHQHSSEQKKINSRKRE